MSDAPTNDPSTHGRARLTFADRAEIDEFVSALQRFETGELSADEWRAFRLVRGTYGQRQDGDWSMVRVKFPQGVMEAGQLSALADAAEKYSRGFGHLTTRQNVQLHFVHLPDVAKVMDEVAAAGATTRTACGNSVRNITACPYAGVSATEPFDVTPYSEALTRFLLRHPLGAQLPRKFKIAFEGCSEDHTATNINDVGFTARVREEGGRQRRGFRVVIGGSTSIMPRSALELYDFLPAGEVLEVAEAVIRVFHRLGDRVHRQRNRMKFLLHELGLERFREEFHRELEAVRAAGESKLPFDPDTAEGEQAPTWERPAAPSVADIVRRVAAGALRGPGVVPQVAPQRTPSEAAFTAFARTNVRPQRQGGFNVVTVTVTLGDLTSEQMRVLAELSSAYCDGTVRISLGQNVLFRWVRDGDVKELYRRLAAAGLGRAGADTLADVTSCPGADSCKLAVTQSRGLGRVLGEFLDGRPDLVDAVPGLDVKISGCPHGCGQHHIAGIGFQGSVRKVGAQIVPQYFVMLGGAADADRAARFGRIAAKVPARRIPQVVERLVKLYLAEREAGETARAFFARLGLDRAKSILKDLEELTPQSLTPEDTIDLGETTQFKVETQAGECAS